MVTGRLISRAKVQESDHYATDLFCPDGFVLRCELGLSVGSKPEEESNPGERVTRA